MRYRMSVIYGHPVIAATRALRFADHVTKRNGGSRDENGMRTEGIKAFSKLIGVVVWTGENDTKTISVDANLFENGASFENGLV